MKAPRPPAVDRLTLKGAADAVLMAARNLIDIQDASGQVPYSINWHTELESAARTYTRLWWERSRTVARPLRRKGRRARRKPK